MIIRPSDSDWFKLDVSMNNEEKISGEKTHLFIGVLLSAVFFIAIIVFILLEILIAFK
jgi:hypothetical protein